MDQQPDDPTDRMNFNQLDDDGLPGIDKNFPPDQPIVVDEPDILTERDESALDTGDDPVAPLMDPSSGDPSVAGDLVDSEQSMIATEGRGDPDAALTAEEAAMHIVDEG